MELKSGSEKKRSEREEMLLAVVGDAGVWYTFESGEVMSILGMMRLSSTSSTFSVSGVGRFGELGVEVLNCDGNADVETDNRSLVGISGVLGNEEVDDFGTTGRSPTAAVHIHFLCCGTPHMDP